MREREHPVIICGNSFTEEYESLKRVAGGDIAAQFPNSGFKKN